MDKLFPSNRRRILAGIATMALSRGGFAVSAGGRCRAAARRRVDRHVEPVCRHHRSRLALPPPRWRSRIFSAGPHKMKRQIEVVSGDHMNKADLGVNIAREWIDRNNVEAIIDVPNSSVALAVRNIVQQNNKVILVSGASSSDLTGKACSPNLVHWSYDTYALSTGTARAVVAERRQDLVHADRRLRVRPRDGGGSEERRPEARRHGRRRRPHANQQPGLFVVPAAGAGLESAGRRPDQCRRRHHQLDQAVGRVRHSAGRPARRGDRALSQRRAFARVEGRAGASVHRIVLLGPERRYARLGQAFRPA